MNLLAVDDQVNVVRSIAAGIDWRSIGIDQVFQACSVAQAQKIFRNHPVDILLCDIEMPTENGFDLLKWIHSEGYEAECIFLTAHADFTYAKEAIRMESFDYILKPVRYSEIESAVSRAMKKISEKRDLNRLARVGKQVENRELPPPIDSDADEDESIKRMNQVKRYIARNLDCDLKRDEIAESVHLNPNYLSRLFTRMEGISLKDYITQEKMRMAREMIKTTRFSISIIAMKVGYTNISHFSQVYRQYFGVSPSEERKEP